MITINEATEQIKRHLKRLSPEQIPLDEALNRVVSDDVYSREPSPPFTNSAMDGFAVRWSDIQNISPDNPVSLEIIGEAQAGIPFSETVGTDQAVQISTGAMLPEGADTVVPLEECETESGTVKVLKIKSKGKHVRLRGEEFGKGELLVRNGTLIGPEQLALMASQGICQVNVFRQPKVILFTTGTELKHYSEAEIEAHQIRDSNSIMIKSLVFQAGAVFMGHYHIGDNLKDTSEMVSRLEDKADILIFTGGVSVGLHDHVRDAAKSLGFQQIFWRIKQKPGKPFFFALKEEKLWFGLPGNPVSAFMGFVHYIFPTIKFMTGQQFQWPTITGILMSDLKAKGNRGEFRRVKLHKEGDSVFTEVLPKQGSHMLTSINEAQGYILLKPEQSFEKNQQIKVYLFPWRLYEWVH